MVWHDTHRNSISGIWNDHMVDGSMKNKDYTGIWLAFLLIALWCFWLIGCSSTPTNTPIEEEAVNEWTPEYFYKPNDWNQHYWVVTDEQEAETFPVEEEEPIEETNIHEDPILEKLIELNIVETI